MCGGVIFPYKEEYREMLEALYSPEEVARFAQTGEVRSLYWQKAEPVLPVILGEVEEGPETEQRGQPQLMRWGNRDKNAPFPQTGWARLESLEEGKWRYLRPRPAMIPVSYGVEKGKWFSIKTGIAGMVVVKNGEERIYMLTREAEPEFLEKTRHERMPVLVDQSDFPWLSGDPSGTKSALQSSFHMDR